MRQEKTESLTKSSFDLLLGNTPVREIFEFDELDSTNRLARTLLLDREKKNDQQEAASPDVPFLVTARSQTAGRGRGDHRWWSPEGGLFLTVAAFWRDFALTRDEPVEISLQTAHAVADTAMEIIAEWMPNPDNRPQIKIKPPNDVYLNGKKLAGILIESTAGDYLLIGIGINLNNHPEEAPEEIRNHITSLAAEIKKNIDVPRFVLRLMQNLFGCQK